MNTKRVQAKANPTLRLNTEIARRKVAECALEQSQQHYQHLLEQSRQMQGQLRHLSRLLLVEQEEQRKEISRELHDEIAQILAGINVHLAALKIEAVANTKGISKKIAITQRLVEKSVKVVHRFACNLRPMALDDLGIIPALQSYLKDFSKRTGIRTHFTSITGVEELDCTKRTVLFRVAQAALTNVAQHAHAHQAKVTIRKLAGAICLKISDDGKSFDVERVLAAKMNHHLGLIGMRERIDMVGGHFSVTSTPGHGTTICAVIPSQESHSKRPQSKTAKPLKE
jgi:signal transduction histidine kinase